MLRLLVRLALAALAAPLSACTRPAEPPPAAPAPAPDPEEEAAAARAAAYRTHLDAGTRALAAGDPDAAVTHLNRAVGTDPAGADAHFQLGRALVAQKDDAAALKALGEALRLNPQNADAFLERAAVHDRAGRLADASYDYRQAAGVERDPKTTARAYWLRSSVADRLGDRADFRRDRDKALALDADYQKLLTAGDVLVFNHTELKLRVALERLVTADGTERTFPAPIEFALPEDRSAFLLDGDRPFVARSVRFTVKTDVGTRTFEQTYQKGTALEVHIYRPDLPVVLPGG
jgi:tetratricopeptide (TPR) repeat protein